MFGNPQQPMSPLAEQLMQREMQPQQGQPPQGPGMGMPQMEGQQPPPGMPPQGGMPGMEQPGGMPGMGGQPGMGQGKPLPPENWMAPGPTGGASDILNSMAFQAQGNKNKVKVSDPYGGSQEVTSGPPDPPKSQLPAAPPWVRQMMGQ